MKKIILIQPNYKGKKSIPYQENHPPIGLCYLGAILEREKIPVQIIDANVRNLSIKQTANLIKRKRPRYVGFSILTPAAEWSTQVIKLLPKTMIKIAGGAHPSATPEDMLKRGFNIVVIGEGEETLLEIIKSKNLAEIKGIAWRENKKIYRNPDRPLLDPDSLPTPARHLIENGGTDLPYFSLGNRYFPWAPIITSRGCPFNCYFCNKTIFGHKFRPRSPEKIIDEVDQLVRNYKIKELNIYDDCFNFDIGRAERIMDLISERNYKLYIRFGNGIRADKITKRLLKKMKAAGTDFIAYGVESGDQKILHSIPKGESHKQILKAIKLTKEAKIQAAGFFILGLLGDTKKTMQKTIDFAIKADLDRVFFNIAIPFPGTRMAKIIKESGGKILVDRWESFDNTAGKMLFTMPGMAQPSEVEEMYRKSYSSFYFRPKYLFRQIPKLLSPSLIPIMFRGIAKIFHSRKEN
ncbi:MAG: radical SAM protein [bacterium]|nr:radical SAM protein [bacterium]